MEQELASLIGLYGWRRIPATLITREGHQIDTSGDVWHLPIITEQSVTLDFRKIANLKIRWANMSYVAQRLERTSTASGKIAFTRVWTSFLRHQCKFDIENNEDCKEGLIALIEDAINKYRSNHKLYDLYEPIKWYIWCAEHYPELGFCPAYAMELDGMTIPGGPKGEAIRMGDPETGPLHKTLELPLIIKALKNDTGTALIHFQQRAAMALSLALGRNPANLTYLLEEDLCDLTPTSTERSFVIRMPRIKKRQLNPRDDLLDEYLDPEIAKHLVALINKNKEIDCVVEKDGKLVEIPRPLFIKQGINRAAKLTGLWKLIYNMTSADICELIQGFVRRNEIISPVTERPLHITVRRMRYTIGTNLAAEGISRKELARILDHTDTQHVGVYFESAGNIVEHLDKASAMNFAKYLEGFQGRIINDDKDAVNGERDDKQLAFFSEGNHADITDIGICGKQEVCHLDPPFSCYLCPKFQPYKHADHEHVLDCLLNSRSARLEKYEQARIGVQLDDVIFAVAHVASLCRSEVTNE